MPAPGKVAMDAEAGLALGAIMAAWATDNVTGYTGPMTWERVMQAQAQYNEAAEHFRKAEAVAPDDASAMCLRALCEFSLIACCSQHIVADFNPAAAFGAAGAQLRETIER